VLVVDDDEGFRRALARALRKRGYDVDGCGSAEEARTKVPGETADIVVLDHQLPDADGLDLLEELRASAAGSVFLMATAYPSLDGAVEAMRRGAFDYVAKGELEECLMRVERAGNVASLRRQVAESHAQEGEQGLIGESPQMRALRDRLRALAASDHTTVLIIGETGTGKGVVARWIHGHSGRAFEPFVAVDCTTIPETLVESELFGHEKGSFSGATASKMGRVEAAGKGTLFLDEIGELHLPVQAKLLRLLEEREYTRVGSTRTRNVTARIITATNRDLSAAVREGRFREDLRYRLEVFVVETPPLRTRGSDIELLAEHFLTKHARAIGKRVPVLSDPVRRALRSYEFPGNVRELRNMLEQALLLSGGDTLTLGDFPVLSRSRSPYARTSTNDRVSPPSAPPLEVYPAPSVPPPPPAVHSSSAAEPEPRTLAEIRARAQAEERAGMIRALESTGGNVTAAARTLGLSRYQLLRRLKKHGLR